MRGDGVVRKRPESEFWFVRFYDDNGKEQREVPVDPRTGQKLPWRDPAGVMASVFESKFQPGQDDPRTYALAEKYLARRRHEVVESKLGGRAFTAPQHQRVTVNELLDLVQPYWLEHGKAKMASSSAYKSHLKLAREAFGQERACRLVDKPAIVADYRTRCLAEGLAPGTLNRRLQLVTLAFKIGVEKKLITKQLIIKKLPENNVRGDFMEAEDFRAVMALLPDDGLRDFCQFAWASMWRKGACSKLTWTDIGGNSVRLPGAKSKTGQPVVVPLTELAEDGTEVLSEIGEIIKKRRAARAYKSETGEERLSSYVFHRGNGRRILDFRKVWNNACLKVGLAFLVCPRCWTTDENGKKQYVPVGADGRCPRCEVKWHRERLRYEGPLFHGLRRSGAKDATDAGVDRGTIMATAGWLTDSMFQRYCIRPLKAQQVGLRKLREFRENQRERKVAVMRPGTGGANAAAV